MPVPYTLHEWGLVAATYGNATARMVSGPTGTSTFGSLGVGGLGGTLGSVGEGLRGVGKPVLYVHMDDGTDALTLDVAVRPAGGARVLEVFPDATMPADRTSLRWGEVRVTRGACHGAYPALADTRCQTEDGLCEQSELARYETDDSDCVHVGETAAGLLFYRTGSAEAELPLLVERGDAGAVRVRPRDGAPPMRGWIMRIQRGADRSTTMVRVASLEGVGQESLVLAQAQGDGVVPGDQARITLGQALAEAGLTDAERDAFMAAWSDALFGRESGAAAAGPPAGAHGEGAGLEGGIIGSGALGGAANGPGAARGVSASGRPGRPFTTIGRIGGGPPTPQHVLGSVQDAVLYVVPPASVDALLPLEAAPAPREVRRVFVARVDLTPLDRVTLRAGRATVTGALEEPVVRRVIRRHFWPLRQCLHANESATNLQATLRVQPSGAVSEATLGGDSLGEEERACFLEAMRAIRFPTAETVTDVNQPFVIAR